jgi:hypothetical protein
MLCFRKKTADTEDKGCMRDDWEMVDIADRAVQDVPADDEVPENEEPEVYNFCGIVRDIVCDFNDFLAHVDEEVREDIRATVRGIRALVDMMRS